MNQGSDVACVGVAPGKPGVSQPLTSPSRIASIDIFRGLTILTMIYVNDVHYRTGIPAWMMHQPPDQDGMTLVDVVFPAFLFIVGMALPFAIQRRLAAGESRLGVARHLLLRTLGLLVIGVYMVNIRGLDPAATGIGTDLWSVLVFTGIILVWNRYPEAAGARRVLFAGLRLAGITLLIGLAVVYRGRDGEQVTWMRTQWWGIIGLIGWAYLTAGLAYLFLRRRPAAMPGVLALLIALYIGDKTGALNFLGSADSLRSIRHWVWLGGHIGTHGAVTVAGVLVAMILMHPALTGHAARAAHILGLAAALFAGGFLLRPLYGISKQATTPTYALYTSAICCLVYLLLWALVDLRNRQAGWRFLRLAGANPLLAYILRDYLYAGLGVLGVEFHKRYLTAGLPAMARSAVLAALLVALAGRCYRWRIRLQV